MRVFFKMFVFLILVTILNIYVLIFHPEIKEPLVAIDLLSFAMAIAILYGDIMSDDESE